MGAGKTSVGQTLATSLGWRFVDLDARITAKTGRTIAQIFAQDGEPSFRNLEHTELRLLLDEPGPTVLSLGGGAWTQPANTALLATLPVFFLDAPVEDLWQRCLPEQATRPLLQSETAFRQLYTARQTAYATGTTRINTQARTIEQVSTEIQLLLGLAPTPTST